MWSWANVFGLGFFGAWLFGGKAVGVLTGGWLLKSEVELPDSGLLIQQHILLLLQAREKVSHSGVQSVLICVAHPHKLKNMISEFVKYF